jgi:beta-lactamase class A
LEKDNRNYKSKSRKSFFIIITFLIITVVCFCAILFFGEYLFPNKAYEVPVSIHNENTGRDNASDIDKTSHELPAGLDESPMDMTNQSDNDEQSKIEKKKEDLENLKRDIEGYISQFPGKYGLYFINLETGQEFGINDTDEYIAASTSKLPINLYLYARIEDKTIEPEDVLVYIEEDFEAGSGIVQNGSYGDRYTVREASRLSIEISDNCAINMIIRLCGIDNIRQYMLDIGGSIYYGPRYRTCPKDMAMYLKELYRLYLENPEVYGELINYLQNTIFNDRINALLPDDIKVAHKVGNQVSSMSDVGIVFADQPYVLAMMSDNVNPSEACEVIAKVSKMIFDCTQEAYKSDEHVN